MIPKSLIYKLVRKSDNIIIAEGNHKEIQKLQKVQTDCFIGIGSYLPSIGEKFGTPSEVVQPASLMVEGEGAPQYTMFDLPKDTQLALL